MGFLNVHVGCGFGPEIHWVVSFEPENMNNNGLSNQVCAEHIFSPDSYVTNERNSSLLSCWLNLVFLFLTRDRGSRLHIRASHCSGDWSEVCSFEEAKETTRYPIPSLHVFT